MHTLEDSELLKKLQANLKEESQPKPKSVFKQKKRKPKAQNQSGFEDIEQEFLQADVGDVDVNDPEFARLPKSQKTKPRPTPQLKQTDGQVPELRDDVDIGKYFGEGE